MPSAGGLPLLAAVAPLHSALPGLLRALVRGGARANAVTDGGWSLPMLVAQSLAHSNGAHTANSNNNNNSSNSNNSNNAATAANASASASSGGATAAGAAASNATGAGAGAGAGSPQSAGDGSSGGGSGNGIANAYAASEWSCVAELLHLGIISPVTASLRHVSTAVAVGGVDPAFAFAAAATAASASAAANKARSQGVLTLAQQQSTHGNGLAGGSAGQGQEVKPPVTPGSSSVLPAVGHKVKPAPFPLTREALHLYANIQLSPTTPPPGTMTATTAATPAAAPATTAPSAASHSDLLSASSSHDFSTLFTFWSQMPPSVLASVSVSPVLLSVTNNNTTSHHHRSPDFPNSNHTRTRSHAPFPFPSASASADLATTTGAGADTSGGSLLTVMIRAGAPGAAVAAVLRLAPSLAAVTDGVAVAGRGVDGAGVRGVVLACNRGLSTAVATDGDDALGDGALGFAGQSHDLSQHLSRASALSGASAGIKGSYTDAELAGLALRSLGTTVLPLESQPTTVSEVLEARQQFIWWHQHTSVSSKGYFLKSSATDLAFQGLLKSLDSTHFNYLLAKSRNDGQDWMFTMHRRDLSAEFYSLKKYLLRNGTTPGAKGTTKQLRGDLFTPRPLSEAAIVLLHSYVRALSYGAVTTDIFSPVTASRHIGPDTGADKGDLSEQQVFTTIDGVPMAMNLNRAPDTDADAGQHATRTLTSIGSAAYPQSYYSHFKSYLLQMERGGNMPQSLQLPPPPPYWVARAQPLLAPFFDPDNTALGLLLLAPTLRAIGSGNTHITAATAAPNSSAKSLHAQAAGTTDGATMRLGYDGARGGAGASGRSPLILAISVLQTLTNSSVSNTLSSPQKQQQRNGSTSSSGGSLSPYQQRQQQQIEAQAAAAAVVDILMAPVPPRTITVKLPQSHGKTITEAEIVSTSNPTNATASPSPLASVASAGAGAPSPNTNNTSSSSAALLNDALFLEAAQLSSLSRTSTMTSLLSALLPLPVPVWLGPLNQSQAAFVKSLALVLYRKTHSFSKKSTATNALADAAVAVDASDAVTQRFINKSVRALVNRRIESISLQSPPPLLLAAARAPSVVPLLVSVGAWPLCLYLPQSNRGSSSAYLSNTRSLLEGTRITHYNHNVFTSANGITDMNGVPANGTNQPQAASRSRRHGRCVTVVANADDFTGDGDDYAGALVQTEPLTPLMVLTRLRNGISTTPFSPPASVGAANRSSPDNSHNGGAFTVRCGGEPAVNIACKALAVAEAATFSAKFRDTNAKASADAVDVDGDSDVNAEANSSAVSTVLAVTSGDSATLRALISTLTPFTQQQKQHYSHYNIDSCALTSSSAATSAGSDRVATVAAAFEAAVKAQAQASCVARTTAAAAGAHSAQAAVASIASVVASSAVSAAAVLLLRPPLPYTQSLLHLAAAADSAEAVALLLDHKIGLASVTVNNDNNDHSGEDDSTETDAAAAAAKETADVAAAWGIPFDSSRAVDTQSAPVSNSHDDACTLWVLDCDSRGITPLDVARNVRASSAVLTLLEQYESTNVFNQYRQHKRKLQQQLHLQRQQLLQQQQKRQQQAAHQQQSLSELDATSSRGSDQGAHAGAGAVGAVSGDADADAVSDIIMLVSGAAAPTNSGDSSMSSSSNNNNSSACAKGVETASKLRRQRQMLRMQARQQGPGQDAAHGQRHKYERAPAARWRAQPQSQSQSLSKLESQQLTDESMRALLFPAVFEALVFDDDTANNNNNSPKGNNIG